MTICEKVFARTSGKTEAAPGEVLWVEPDLVLMYDYPGLTDEFERILRDELKTNIRKPEKCRLFIDHFVPPASEKESDFHHHTRWWAAQQKVQLIENLGIGHQVTAELCLARPGMFIAHSDMHIHPIGAFGTVAFSLLTDIITAYALGKIWLEIPETIKVNLTGSFRDGVSGRDFINHFLGFLGPDGAINAYLEFHGDGAESMSIDDRMTILSEILFCGAHGGIFPANEPVIKYIKERTGETVSPVVPDSGAVYRDTLSFDLSKIEPTVIAPGGLTDAQTIGKVRGLTLNQAYIGSCAAGRVSDIETAARILKGRRIKDGFRLNVVPSSREVLQKTIESQALGVLVEAGAFISSPSCDYCYGKTQAISRGERAVSTGTLNVPGRMGSSAAEIYLASSAVAAASSINGELADPRNYL
jgi:3-isopropylmalate/(R)-2-methylmalate dehydratase large subunit